MSPKNSTKQIPSLGICHRITLKSKGHKQVVHGLDLQVLVGLVMAKCAKPDEYNVWLMPKASTTFPTMVEDHMVSLE
jgi:hypothetical protein